MAHFSFVLYQPISFIEIWGEQQSVGHSVGGGLECMCWLNQDFQRRAERLKSAVNLPASLRRQVADGDPAILGTNNRKAREPTLNQSEMLWK